MPEVHAQATRHLLREGMTLLAPDLIWAEVANALWRKWREKELPAEVVQEILTDFRRFPLRIHSGESLYDVAWPVAQGSGRTFDDSLYLALAMSGGCPLVPPTYASSTHCETRRGDGIAYGWRSCHLLITQLFRIQQRLC